MAAACLNSLGTDAFPEVMMGRLRGPEPGSPGPGHGPWVLAAAAAHLAVCLEPAIVACSKCSFHQSSPGGGEEMVPRLLLAPEALRPEQPEHPHGCWLSVLPRSFCLFFPSYAGIYCVELRVIKVIPGSCF